MNTTSDSGLRRRLEELRSHSLELRTKASELIGAAQRARQYSVRARAAFRPILRVVSIGVELRIQESPKPMEQLLAS